MCLDKYVSKPFTWRSNWIQRVGHFCHRQEHYTDGKVFRGIAHSLFRH